MIHLMRGYFDPLASSCLWFFPARAWPSSYRYNNYRCFSWWLNLRILPTCAFYLWYSRCLGIIHTSQKLSKN